MKREVIELPAKDPADIQTRRKQLRVAAYCRVSTSLEAQQNSYEAQKEYYTNKILSNPDWTLAGIFADKGITGTSVEKRAGFQRMIRWCQQGKIDLILTKSISRFARNTLDCLHYVRLLQQLNIPIIFESEGIDSSQMSNELILTLMGATSQAESEAISSRVKWGVRASFKEGNVRYSYKSWLGYRKGENGEPEIIPEEAVIVRQIFTAYLDGKSLRDIKALLESQKRLTKSGQEKWPISSINSILRNEKYTGDAILQKTYTTDPISKKRRRNAGELPKYFVKNCHPAIISHEMFELVQKELERRGESVGAIKSVAPKQTKSYSSKHALTGILICGKCNTPYRRCVWHMKHKIRTVWRCCNRLDHGKQYCKHSPTLDESPLQQALITAINHQLHRPEYLLAPFNRASLESSSAELIPPAKSWPELYANLLELQRRIDHSFTELLMQCAEQKDWETHESQFRELVKQRAEYDEYIDAFDMQQYEDERRKNTYHLPFQLTEYNETIIRQVLDTVRVLDAKRLLITFKGGAEVEQAIES
jgi:DNA invertase Pin-like site-specific DNA recombinase